MSNMIGYLYILKVFMLSMVMGQPLHPNILFIMVDDLRPALGCYGDQLALTPSLDALSHAGVTFSSAFAQEALCGPSRTSLLTSRRPDSTCIVDAHHYWRDYHNFTTLPQHFKEHGYYTASAGKIFHPGRCSNYSDDSPYSWSAIPYHPSTQQHKNSPVCGLHRNMTNIVCPVRLEDQPEGTLPDLQTTHYAISFMQHWHHRRSALPDCTHCRGSFVGCECSQPFFMAVGYHKPHIPLKFPRQFLELFPLSSVPLAPDPHLPDGLPPVAYNPWNDLRWRDDVAALNLTFPYEAIPKRYARKIRQAYYAATAYIDLLIGDLLAATYLLHPDTLVVVMGDHGWSLGEHQEWSKFSNYDVATRVPLIVAPLSRYPGAKTAVLNDKTSPKYFRYKKYIKLQKKVLNNVDKWAGSGANKLSQHWLPNEQGKSSGLKDDVPFTVMKSDDRHHHSPRYERSNKLKKENSAQQEKSSISSSRDGHTRVPINDHGSINVQFKSNKVKQRKRHRSRNLAHFMKRARYSSSRSETSVNGTNTIWRELKKNFTYYGIVELLDVFPTLADLAGISKVPSCDGNSHTVNFRSEVANDLIPEGIRLEVLNRGQKRNSDKETSRKVSNENFVSRFSYKYKCGRRTPDFRRIFIEKLRTAVRKSSKILGSALKSQSNSTDGGVPDAVWSLGDTDNFKKHFRNHISGHRSKSPADSGTPRFHEGHERRNLYASSSFSFDVLARLRDLQLRDKLLHTMVRKPLGNIFSSDMELAVGHEVRLCTEGQSLVPFIVEQPFVNFSSPYPTKKTPSKRNSQKKKVLASIPLVRNYRGILSKSLKLTDCSAKATDSSSLVSESLQQESSSRMSTRKDRSIDVSEDYGSLKATPEQPRHTSLANTNSDTAYKSRLQSAQSVATASGAKGVADVHEASTNSQDETLSCLADAEFGRLAISQYPRPSFYPSQNPDSDQPKLKDMRIMGYSLRSRCYRYTLWVAYNSSSQTSNFNEVLAEELYDHRLDPREDHNLLYGL